MSIFAFVGFLTNFIYAHIMNTDTIWTLYSGECSISNTIGAILMYCFFAGMLVVFLCMVWAIADFGKNTVKKKGD